MSRRTGVPSEEPFREVLVEFLNLVIGQSEFSQEYWHRIIKNSLQSKFPGILTDHEMSETFDLLKKLEETDDFKVTTLLDYLGIRVSPSAAKEISWNRFKFKFVQPGMHSLNTF